MGGVGVEGSGRKGQGVGGRGWEGPGGGRGRGGVGGGGGYMRTLERVSGSLSPTRPPPTSTAEASRMGMALVMPTREPKIRFPITAASLHMALQKPNPVPLEEKHRDGQCVCVCGTCMHVCVSVTTHLLSVG